MQQEKQPPRRLAIVAISKAMGGMESVCVDLCREYVRMGHRVAVVMPPDGTFDEFAERVSAAGGEVQRFALDRRAGIVRHARDAARFGKWLRAWKPDAIHVHTGGTRGGTIAALAARGTAGRTPLILTEHEVPPERPARGQWLSRRVLDRVCSATTAISRRNATMRAERFGWRPRNFAAILNGTPVEHPVDERWSADRAAIREQFGVSEDTLLAGSLVRFSPDKNVDDVIQAVAMARTEGADVELLLVGDGVLRQQLESLVRELHLEEAVHFAGHQTEPLRFLPAIDVFTLAVAGGSGSIALLEALAYGVPAVITFCGPEEAVLDGETGLCAQPHNPESIARAFVQLATDPPRRREMGRCGRCLVAKTFSSRRVATDYLDLYTSLRQGTVPDRLRV